MSALYSLAAIVWGGSLLSIVAIGIIGAVSPRLRGQFWGVEEARADERPLRVTVRNS